MHNTIINTITLINEINEHIFRPFDLMIDKLPVSDWLADAISDSIHMLPFLFLIFVLIEIIEYFYSNKIAEITKYSKAAGPLAGSIAASFPQCGFSVIASTLYTKKMITAGTLIAVYLSTSDEAIPVLLAEPTKIHLLLPLLMTKIIIALISGYTIDFIYTKDKKQDIAEESSNNEPQEGCCKHFINKPVKKDLFLHPLKHTLNVFMFILFITVGLNYFIHIIGGEENLGQYLLNNSLFQPVITALVGLIPNCAVSIAITLMYLKGAIGFGSVISGLCSGAGLGILVLIRKNNSIKDTCRIISLLLLISIMSGIIIQIVYN